MAGGMHGRGHAWQGACVAGGGGMHGRGCAWQGAHVAGGMHGRGHAWQGRMRVEGACMTGETATAVDGTHPTGMHSCFAFFVETENIKPEILTSLTF